jgi:ribosome-associated toxin RatA of RatAB toxin-antitoxin module
MATHNASVTINAPINQVYQLWTHFNDFPKFMTFVKEVTYIDDSTSHWVADIIGKHEWDAVNSAWIENKQIGWKSTDGLQNAGVVQFEAVGNNQTRIDVNIHYDPPAGLLGDIGEALGAGGMFERSLQHDLNNFGKMVNGSPAGALDPQSSSYLFHGDSAVATGTTTQEQEISSNSSKFTADDPHFFASVAPPSINSNFTTDMRDDFPPNTIDAPVSNTSLSDEDRGF